MALTTEEKNYIILTTYLKVGPYAAADEASRLFHLDLRAARLKVQWVVDQAGDEVEW